MDINIHNYEAYLLDYFEGNLSPAEAIELKDFSIAHPELNIEMEDEDLIYVNTPSILPSIDKNELKCCAAPSDDEFVQYIEKQMGKEEQITFEKLLDSNPSYKNDLKIWFSTILDKPNIIYSNKSSLKHYSLAPMIYPLLAAASILTFILLSPNSNQRTYHFSNASISQDVNHFILDKYKFPLLETNKIFTPKKYNPKQDFSLKHIAKNKEVNTVDTISQSFAFNKKNILKNEIVENIKKDTNSTFLKMDSINYTPVQQKSNSSIIANHSTPKNNTLTLKQWVVNKLEEKEIIDTTISDSTLIEIAANSIGNFSKTESENEKITFFKIGKFEYYRKKSKRL